MTYSERLQNAGDRLYLAGMSKSARAELLKNKKFRPAAGVETLLATDVLGESTRKAVAQAEQWIVTHSDEDHTDDSRDADGKR